MTRAQRIRSTTTEACLAAIDEVVAHGTVGPDELAALADSLGAQSTEVQRRAGEAFASLRARGVPVQTVLLAALQSDVACRRWGAAYALSLSDLSPPELLPVLLDSLGSDDGDIRWAAAQIIARRCDWRDVTERLCTLLRAGNGAQRKMAAYCLRDLNRRGAAVEHSLLAALGDVAPGVRMAAMAALARLAADPGMVALRLTGLLRDDADVGVRRAAAAVLGGLGQRSERVLEALRAASMSLDPSLQRAAQRSLRLLAAAPEGSTHESGGVK